MQVMRVQVSLCLISISISSRGKVAMEWMLGPSLMEQTTRWRNSFKNLEFDKIQFIY